MLHVDMIAKEPRTHQDTGNAVVRRGDTSTFPGLDRPTKHKLRLSAHTEDCGA